MGGRELVCPFHTVGSAHISIPASLIGQAAKSFFPRSKLTTVTNLLINRGENVLESDFDAIWNRSSETTE
jgi:hypothetical protein